MWVGILQHAEFNFALIVLSEQESYVLVNLETSHPNRGRHAEWASRQALQGNNIPERINKISPNLISVPCASAVAFRYFKGIEPLLNAS
jgi:hypothetical protein